ncbi:MAG: hypothetical protein ACREJO_07920 [Phycisphaerales bacterium]
MPSHSCAPVISTGAAPRRKRIIRNNLVDAAVLFQPLQITAASLTPGHNPDFRGPPEHPIGAAEMALYTRIV